MTILDSYIGMDENAIECSVQSREMINATFVEELKREKRIANLEGASIEGEHTVFPHICETYLVGVQHDNIRPSETVVLEDFTKLFVNTIEGMEMKGEDVRAIVRPISSGVAPRNWTAINIPIVFHPSQ